MTSHASIQANSLGGAVQGGLSVGSQKKRDRVLQSSRCFRTIAERLSNRGAVVVSVRCGG